MGHTPKIAGPCDRSALPQDLPKTNGCEFGCSVQLSAVSKCGRRCGCRARYSITSSARASSVGGIVRPSAFAAFKLTTSSNLEGC